MRQFHIYGVITDAATGVRIAGAKIGLRDPNVPISTFFVGDSVDLSKIDPSVSVQTTAADGSFDLIYTASERDTLKYQFLFAWKSKSHLWRYDTSPAARTIQNDTMETMTVHAPELKTVDYFPLAQGSQWTYYYHYDDATRDPTGDPTFTPTVVHNAGTTTWTVKSVEESGGAKTYTIDAQYVDSTDNTKNTQGSFQILEAADHRITISTPPTDVHLMAIRAANVLTAYPFYRFHKESEAVKIQWPVVASPDVPVLFITRSTGISHEGTGGMFHTYSYSESFDLLSFK